MYVIWLNTFHEHRFSISTQLLAKRSQPALGNVYGMANTSEENFDVELGIWRKSPIVFRKLVHQLPGGRDSRSHGDSQAVLVCYLVTLLNRSELSSFTMAAFSASKLPTWWRSSSSWERKKQQLENEGVNMVAKASLFKISTFPRWK